ATHAVLSGPAIDRIDKSVIKELILLDTISIPQDKMLDKFTILPVAPVFAEAIERIYEDKPVSSISIGV
ncbi:MAG: ribose-phosphate pyrophosphokinase, partial [Clostridia bacterium]|nr:ribose-phosphate pyrophosphokinase [Clostridia bacterium]